MLSPYRGNSQATSPQASDKPILVSFSGDQLVNSLAITGQTVAIATGVLAVDRDLGEYVIVSLNANITSFTIANPPTSGDYGGILCKFIGDGTVRTISWPSGIVWANAIAPTMTGTLNKRDFVQLVTDDAGTTWFGFVLGQNF